MPDRLIKESSCISDTLAALSDFGERFWWRLTVNCDDYGRCDARPAVLKSKLFPLADDRIPADMTTALNELASVGLVTVYTVDGRPYLQVVTWGKHQRIRAKRSKYPAPEDGVCCQMTADDNKCPRNPIQSESNPNPNQSIDKADKPPKPLRHKYGEYKNVLLSDEEFAKLQSEIPCWQEMIERLSSYMESHGRTYKSHLATMRNWYRKEQSIDKGKDPMPDYGGAGNWSL